jgi:hypothetical protein
MFAGSCCDACLGAAVRPEGTGILSRRDEPLLLSVKSPSLSTIANEQCHQPCKKTTRVNNLSRSRRDERRVHAKALNP